MFQEVHTPIRHQTEYALTLRAAAGEADAAAKLLQYLGSANAYLRQIMLETVHDCGATELWDHLLRCLAFHRWGDLPVSARLADPVARQRIDSAISEAFQADEREAERQVKENVLRTGLAAEETQVRYAAAYLLGLRSEAGAISVLEEMVDKGEPEWQLRAVAALGEIRDTRSGYPVLRAMAKDHRLLHQESKWALCKLSRYAKPALLEALSHPDDHIRWHAARSLGVIGSPEGAQLLVESLLDENAAVRWAAADVLARLDAAVVPLILRQLVETPLTEQYRQVVYHALHAMLSHSTQARLKPLLQALHSLAARLEVPAAAQRLLAEWEPKLE
jgi:HEAT repeat protein